eukprot:TRINITY_DN6205_c0_g2_i1.p1 TRINITY_DN6205_c0_g2~~TRINITY_DN6205_c0_g2_i1.p1  ORF type:complete len:614 (+),score=138.78 TRINITY_DN6205_c0_g2_i1:47-1843(+)
MPRITTVCAMLALLCRGAAQSTCTEEGSATPSEIFASLDFDKNQLPVHKDADGKRKPVGLKVTQTVTKINEFSTKLQTFKINMYFRHQWVDHRLKWNSTEFCDTVQIADVPSTLIWVPDTFFPSSNEIKKPDGEEFVTIQNDGTVLWSKRVVLNLFCAMDFIYYPFDIQTCTSSIESYAHSPEKIRYIAPEAGDRYIDQIGFVDGQETFSVGPYKVGVPTAQMREQSIGNNKFSQVIYTWTFERAKGRFIATNLTQLWLVVAMSFMGLFVNVEVAPARVAIGLISVLTCMNILNRLLADIPVVPNITGMDWLYLITAYFVVMNVAEYCLVNYLISSLGTQEKRASELKRRRHANFPPSSRACTHKKIKLAKCELSELFHMFDTGEDGVLTRSEASALILSIAADRARPVDVKLVTETVNDLPRLITFTDLCTLLLGSNQLAEKVGLNYEPKGSMLLWGAAWSKKDILIVERVYRMWAPIFYIYAHFMWFLALLSRSDLLLIFLLGTVFFLILVFGCFRYVKSCFSVKAVETSSELKPGAEKDPPSSSGSPIPIYATQTRDSATFKEASPKLGQPLLRNTTDESSAPRLSTYSATRSFR